jgi:methionine-gamma-lyase
VVLARDLALIEQLRGLRALFGNILQADEAWILDSRLATVSLRMNRQSKNAQRIAEKLAGHPRVRRIHYPSLFDDPEQKRIRDAQCDFPGSILAIDVDGGKRGAFEFLRRLKIARNAVSLGGIETLACHPKTTTHSELLDQELVEAEITDALVRISVGTEHWKDLLADFEAALG